MIYNDSKYNSEWQIRLLSQLGTFNRGLSKHRPRNDKRLYIDGKYPFIQTGNIKEANLYIRTHTDAYNDIGLKQSKIWPENTLCITIAANIAETALLGYPMCFPDSVVGFNAYPNESSEIFMHYVFTYIKRAIQNSASGSIQDNINIDYLTTLKFKVPPKPYQDKIVNILSAIDLKIEINDRINTELESMAKTLFDYWFIQFDFPEEDGKPYKSSGKNMTWNDELKRNIPKEWKVEKISSKLTIGSGFPFDSETYSKKGKYKVITIKNVQDQKLETSDVDTVDTIPVNLPNFCKLEIGDILMSLTGNVGRMCFVTEEELLLNQRVGKFLCDLKYKNYLYLLFQRIEERIRLENISTGSSQKNLSPIDATDKITVIPPIPILEKFNKHIDSIIEKILVNQIENNNLYHLKDWLLPMIMNGQVKVS